MKNLFNNISQEEKNRILEMHSGKKNVISEQSEHGKGAIIPEPKKNKVATPQMLDKVLKKLNYDIETGGSKLKFMKNIPEKKLTLFVTFTPEYAIVNKKKDKEPTQTGTDGKIHGMGLAIPAEKFPLLLKPNTLKEFENFLMSCEK
jgi:hypothetical protein